MKIAGPDLNTMQKYNYTEREEKPSSDITLIGLIIIVIVFFNS